MIVIRKLRKYPYKHVVGIRKYILKLMLESFRLSLEAFNYKCLLYFKKKLCEAEISANLVIQSVVQLLNFINCWQNTFPCIFFSRLKRRAHFEQRNKFFLKAWISNSYSEILEIFQNYIWLDLYFWCFINRRSGHCFEKEHHKLSFILHLLRRRRR